MGCSHMGNMISSALKRLRGKGKIKRSHKAHNPGSEDKLARSVSQSNHNPIYITHPPAEAEIISTWDPPQKPPDTPAPQLIHPIPDTTHTMTKQVVQVHYADSNDKSAPDHFGPKDPSYSRHESGFTRYSYNDSSVAGREYEESSSSSNNKAEYLYGEYQYYPTPAREGIYNLANDGNHLTSIFSDENPNACTIA